VNPQIHLDLIVLVADADAEWALRTLLEKRTNALQIRQVQCLVVRDPGRDAGVFLHAHDLLRPYHRRATHALVVLDREGSGQEDRLTAKEMEEDLEGRLRSNGWAAQEGRARAKAIVLDPELEVWVWSGSRHVAAVLGLTEKQLADILASTPTGPTGKPEHPKETLEAALRRSRRPFSARVFQELAERASLAPRERAFDKLRHALQCWFPMR